MKTGLQFDFVKMTELIRNPKPGSAVAAGAAFGIDFSLNLERLRLTPEQRLRDLQKAASQLEQMRGAAQRNRRTQVK